MQPNYDRITRLCLVAILSMLIVTSCQSNSTTSATISQTSQVEPTDNIIPENFSSSDVIPTAEGFNNQAQGIDISYLDYQAGNDKMYTVDNGWANYKGVLAFFNHSDRAITLELNNRFEYESSVVIDTEEGEQYEGTIVVKSFDGSLLYKGIRNPSVYLPQKTPITSFPRTVFPAFYFSVEFRVPELLHLTKITISDVFSLPDGTSDFVIDKFFTNVEQWAIQYPVTTTGTLPSTIRFSDGIEMQIQSGWEKMDVQISETYPTICLRANIKNTDITRDANFLDKEFRLILSFGRGDLYMRSASVPELAMYNADGIGFRDIIGPGQQGDVLLCISQFYNDYHSSVSEFSDMALLLNHFDPSKDSHIHLSISGEGVEELLDAKKN